MSLPKHSILNRFFSAAAVLIILGLIAYMVFDLLYVDNAYSGTDSEMDESESRADGIDVFTENSNSDSLETGEAEGNPSEGDREYRSEESTECSSERTDDRGLKVIADGDYL
ncbi:MAG TPA: hypothetical protein ENN91_02880, partial [Firmicutes bacterium]|nr:hypothetical protein [Bacillota bacterium]